MNSRVTYAAIPLSLFSLATCAAICSLDMTGPSSPSMGSLGLGLGLPPLASGSPTTCPAPAWFPTPFRSALAHALMGSTAPSPSFPRPVPSVHPAFLSMRNPTLSAPIFGAAFVLPRAWRGSMEGARWVDGAVPVPTPWTAPDIPRQPPAPPSLDDPRGPPPPDVDGSYPVPASFGTMVPPALNPGPGPSIMAWRRQCPMSRAVGLGKKVFSERDLEPSRGGRSKARRARGATSDIQFHAKRKE